MYFTRRFGIYGLYWGEKITHLKFETHQKKQTNYTPNRLQNSPFSQIQALY